MIPNDEEATVASNEANKSSLVESVESKVTTPALRTGCIENVEA